VLTGRVLPEFTTPAFRNLANRKNEEIEQFFSQRFVTCSEVWYKSLAITFGAICCKDSPSYVLYHLSMHTASNLNI
jgi:hypothetical protein